MQAHEAVNVSDQGPVPAGAGRIATRADHPPPGKISRTHLRPGSGQSALPTADFAYATPSAAAIPVFPTPVSPPLCSLTGCERSERNWGEVARPGRNLEGGRRRVKHSGPLVAGATSVGLAWAWTIVGDSGRRPRIAQNAGWRAHSDVVRRLLSLSLCAGANCPIVPSGIGVRGRVWFSLSAKVIRCYCWPNDRRSVNGGSSAWSDLGSR